MLKIRGGADSTVMRADANADSEVTHNKINFFWGSGLNGQEQHDYKTPEFLVQTPPWVSHIHSNQAYQGQGQGKFICHIHNHTRYNQQWNEGIFEEKYSITWGKWGEKK